MDEFQVILGVNHAPYIQNTLKLAPFIQANPQLHEELSRQVITANNGR